MKRSGIEVAARLKKEQNQRSEVQKMNVRKKYRRFVCFLLVLSIIGLGVCGVEVLRDEIPDQMQVSEEEEVPTPVSYTHLTLPTT